MLGATDVMEDVYYETLLYKVDKKNFTHAVCVSATKTRASGRPRSRDPRAKTHPCSLHRRERSLCSPSVRLRSNANCAITRRRNLFMIP